MSNPPPQPITVSDLAKGQLDVNLAELKIVFDQMHVRMQGIYRLMTQSMVLFTVLLGFFIVHWDRMVQNKTFFLFLLAPIPFYVLTGLQVREQLLMGSHDMYFQILRKRILALLNENQKNNRLLGFLHHIASFKLGGIHGVANILSLLMYAFPGLGITGSLLTFWFVTERYNTLWLWYEKVLVIVHIGICLVLIIGVGFAINYFNKVYDGYKQGDE